MPRYKQPCEECGSSDAVTIYEDFHSHCYSCGHHVFADEDKDEYEEEKEVSLVETNKEVKNFQPLLNDFQEMKDRSISHKTAEKYGVFKSTDPFFSWVYPMFQNGVHVGNKLRRSGDVKGFSIEGEFNKFDLFGQQLFPAGSAKAITICEGQDDAMAAFEMQGSKYPCVSVHSVATARKDCAKAFEYLNSFDEIVLCFDKDEAKRAPDGSSRFPGQEAAKAVAQLFPAKKVRILTLSKAKDANDYLKQGLQKEFVKEWWSAPTFTPDGIRLGTDLWDDVRNNDKTESVEYPFQGFNDMTYGLRLGELVVITADTGVGKTSVLKEIEHYLLNHTSYGIGIMHLEESNKDTALGIMSIEGNKPLHLPDIRDSVTEEELKKYYDKTVNTDRVIIYDHFGSNAIDDLLDKVRHMSAMGAKFIVLDHLSIVVSDQSGDERKQLDEISTKLKTLTMELNICVIAVIHQNRQGQIRGTAGVEQLANIVIKLYRDKEADDPFRRNVTKVSIQKNRFCGRTGPCSYLIYNPETGRLEELDKAGIARYESGVEDTSPQSFPVKDEW